MGALSAMVTRQSLGALKLAWSYGKAELRTTRPMKKNTQLFAESALMFSTPEAQRGLSEYRLSENRRKLVPKLRGLLYTDFDTSEAQKAEVGRLARDIMGPAFDLLKPVREQESAEKTDVARVINGAFLSAQGLILGIIASYIMRNPLESDPGQGNTYLLLRRDPMDGGNLVMGAAYKNIEANTVLTINPSFFTLTDFLYHIQPALFEENTFYEGKYTMVVDRSLETQEVRAKAEEIRKTEESIARLKTRLKQLRSSIAQLGPRVPQFEPKVADSLLKFVAETPRYEFEQEIQGRFPRSAVEPALEDPGHTDTAEQAARKPSRRRKSSKK